MRILVAAVALALVTTVGCDPTLSCTTEEAAKGNCSLSSGSDGTTGPTGATGPTGSTGVGFEAYGTTPSGAHISLDCTPWEVGAYVHHDCLYSHLQDPTTVTCTLKLADRAGVLVGVETTVSFMSEAGAIRAHAVSPAYPATPDSLGHATSYLEVFGGTLPPDVDPLPGEHSASFDFGCGTRIVNPRDGYVTVIAWVKGEEGFADLNQNGRYDQGEPFVDEGEPYVDANDNGRWDPGEWFQDVNGDGVYTGPNGLWDASTVIWSQARVVYKGLPRIFVSDAGGAPPDAGTVPTPFTVHAGPPPTSVSYDLVFTDIFLNPLLADSTYGAASWFGNVQATIAPVSPVVPFRQPPELFRLLYCDRPEFPATCHDGPVESGCRTSPCYVVAETGLCGTDGCSGFQYANPAVLNVTGAKAGPDHVQVSATVAGTTTSVVVSGVCLP
jgi:hypothetical protein